MPVHLGWSKWCTVLDNSSNGSHSIFRKEVSLDKNKVTGIVPELDEFFKEASRSRAILPEQNCEDRSKYFKTSLQFCYKIIIAPLASLLKQPEIITVPDSCVYQVPFAALADEEGKYLSETCRIRLVPSLTTLELVQDSPPDYHSQTGALIVGDPVVGRRLSFNDGGYFKNSVAS